MINKQYDILIVEDEYINAKSIENTLISLNQNVVAIVTNANDAIENVKNNNVDLVFMDINIDGAIDGIMCANLINQLYSIPIIYMTAYGDSQTIDEASDTNLYGYLIKPFDARDVEASLNVVLKILSNRNNLSEEYKEVTTTIELVDNYIYNFKTQTLTINNIIVELTKKEILTLHLFCLNINQNISYELLIEYVWNNKSIINSTIRDTVSRIRKKAPLLHIESISGLGYCLKKE